MTDTDQNVQERVQAISPNRRDFIFGLGTALCFAGSSIFIRNGLAGLSSPLLGVTVGMVVCVIAYGIVLLARRDITSSTSIPRATLLLQIVAGTFVGLSTWARWVALDLAPVAVVIALGRISVPVVLILAPFLIGRNLERVTPRIWLGAALIIAGSLLLIFSDLLL